MLEFAVLIPSFFWIYKKVTSIKDENEIQNLKIQALEHKIDNVASSIEHLTETSEIRYEAINSSILLIFDKINR